MGHKYRDVQQARQIVTKRQSPNGKRRYKHIEGRTQALMVARDTRYIIGYVAINGKTLQGKAGHLNLTDTRLSNRHPVTVIFPVTL